MLLTLAARLPKIGCAAASQATDRLLLPTLASTTAAARFVAQIIREATTLVCCWFYPFATQSLQYIFYHVVVPTKIGVIDALGQQLRLILLGMSDGKCLLCDDPILSRILAIPYTYVGSLPRKPPDITHSRRLVTYFGMVLMLFLLLWNGTTLFSVSVATISRTAFDSTYSDDEGVIWLPEYIMRGQSLDEMIHGQQETRPNDGTMHSAIPLWDKGRYVIMDAHLESGLPKFVASKRYSSLQTDPMHTGHCFPKQHSPLFLVRMVTPDTFAISNVMDDEGDGLECQEVDEDIYHLSEDENPHILHKSGTEVPTNFDVGAILYHNINIPDVLKDVPLVKLQNKRNDMSIYVTHDANDAEYRIAREFTESTRLGGKVLRLPTIRLEGQVLCPPTINNDLETATDVAGATIEIVTDEAFVLIMFEENALLPDAVDSTCTERNNQPEGQVSSLSLAEPSQAHLQGQSSQGQARAQPRLASAPSISQRRVRFTLPSNAGPEEAARAPRADASNVDATCAAPDGAPNSRATAPTNTRTATPAPVPKSVGDSNLQITPPLDLATIRASANFEIKRWTG